MSVARTAWLILWALACVACSDETGGPGPDPDPDPDPDPVPLDPADYLDKPMREQIAALQTGALSCAGLAEAYRARIDERDAGAEGIHAVLLVDPANADNAAALEAEVDPDALLQCAVLLIKDNIDTAGMATTAGSIALAGNVPEADAFAMSRLRDANALALGKTNLSEWANFRGYQSSSGWSSLGGQTHNGFDKTFNPCGSSSGSAAAIAAGLAAATLGTETDGSIVCPASINGVVGFKPTVGLVSRAGVIPISHTQDTIGPITRTVGDAARLMRVLAGPDPADPATAAIPAGLDLDFEAPLETATLEGARFGVLTPRQWDLGVDALFAAELARIEAAGATLVSVQLPSRNTYGNDEFTVLLHEFKVDLNAYLAAHPVTDQPTTLAELIAFNQANAATVMPHFGQEIFEAAEATTGLDDPGYLAARDNAKQVIGPDGIDAVMSTNDLDALLGPTADTAWVTDHANGDLNTVYVGSAPAAVAGYPHLTVPMGLVNGLPVGLSIFASAWQDAAVLALGHAYETLPR